AITKAYTVEDSGNHIALQGEYNGKCRPSPYGQTMVNVCSQKDPVAITKSYTVENSGNHIALQGEYDGKCRPVIQGNTMVNLAPISYHRLNANLSDEVTLNSLNSDPATLTGRIKEFIPIQNLKYGTDYSIVFDIISITEGAMLHGYISYEEGESQYGIINAGTVGRQIIRFNLQNNLDVTKMGLYINSSSVENIIKIKNVMIFEGDLTQTPNLISTEYVEGLKSSFEDNKIPDALVYDDEEFTLTSNGNIATRRYDTSILKTWTTYTFIVDITSNSLTQTRNIFEVHGTYNIGKVYLDPNFTGRIVKKVETRDAIAHLFWLSSDETGSFTAKNYMLLEGDYTSNPPTYEEVINHSGKYRVNYKVAGKNKFDGELENGAILSNGSLLDNEAIRSKNYIPVKPNTKYTISTPNYLGTIYMHEYNINKEVWIPEKSIGSSRIFTTGNNTKYIKFNTVSLGGDLSNFQLEEGESVTSYEPYKSYTKTFYLNSPLLEGDTIEDINGKATHVKRYGKVVLDGSEDEAWKIDSVFDNTIYFYKTPSKQAKPSQIPICDKIKGIQIGNNDSAENIFIYSTGNLNIGIFKSKLSTLDANGFKQWLQANPTTVVYELASPVYETISNESILCDSYTNGHLDFDSAVPVKQIYFKHFDIPLPYSQPNTVYTVQFNADNAGILYNLDVSGGKIKNTNVTKGSNKFTLTTPNEILYSWFTMSGIGFNASNISVVATEREFDYFEGLSSSFEDQLIKDENDPNFGKYKVEYKVTGRNKFNINNVGILNGVKNYSIDNNSISIPFTQFYQDVRYFIPVKRGATYYISYSERTDATILLYKNKVPYGHDTDCYISNVNNSNEPIKIVVDNYDMITLRISSETRDSGIMVVSNIMVRESTSDLYEPYKESTKTFYLNSPLLEGDSIEDINGKATHVKRYGKVVLDGSEDEAWKIDSV
ncbi:MAG: hypothetical protein J6D47_19475, partial [Peptostreptococcaceae bacterium]|nr:hypothetical protein [Peptostreptococcaceae bacterium]